MQLEAEAEVDLGGRKVSVRSLGSAAAVGGADLWAEERPSSPLSAAALSDKGRQAAALLVRLLVLLVPAPLRLASSCFWTLGPSASAAAGPAMAALALHLLRALALGLSLALLCGAVFESGAPSSDLFTVDMSAMAGDPDPAAAATALRSAQVRCRATSEYLWPLAEPLLRSLAPWWQQFCSGFAQLPHLGEAASLEWRDWRDAFASKDLRTIAQYIHCLLLAAVRAAAAFYDSGARCLGSLLHRGLSLTAVHRGRCWAAWVDLTAFLSSNPAAGAFLLAAFSVALIDGALLPAVRARVAVRAEQVRATDSTEKPSQQWRYLTSASSAVAVLLAASVALALLSTSQVALTSEPAVVGVVLRETSWLLKVPVFPIATALPIVFTCSCMFVCMYVNEFE